MNTNKTELQIAQEFVSDKNNNLTNVSKELKIGLPTLYAYRANPEKMATGAWINIHNLSQLALDTKTKTKDER